MLETIRDYALEQLEASGEREDLRRRHAAYFVALSEEAEPSILGVSPTTWLDRLEREHDNLRSALDWLEASGETEPALQLGGTIWEFWCLRNHFSEGWRRLDRLLELDERPTPARARALTGATHLAVGAGVDPETHRLRAEQALDLQRRVGDAWGIAFAEYQFASVFSEIGDFAAARPLLEESVQRFRELGNEHRELQAMRMLAWACQELGDADRHRALHEEILPRAREIGDVENEWWSLSSLAGVASRAGRHPDAIALLAEAYAGVSDFGDPGMVDMTIVRLARALALAGNADAAARLFSLGELVHGEIGWSYEAWFVKQKDEALNVVRAALDEKAFAEAWEQGRTLTADEAVALALECVDR